MTVLHWAAFHNDYNAMLVYEYFNSDLHALTAYPKSEFNSNVGDV